MIINDNEIYIIYTYYGPIPRNLYTSGPVNR